MGRRSPQDFADAEMGARRAAQQYSTRTNKMSTLVEHSSRKDYHDKWDRIAREEVAKTEAGDALDAAMAKSAIGGSGPRSEQEAKDFFDGEHKATLQSQIGALQTQVGFLTKKLASPVFAAPAAYAPAAPGAAPGAGGAPALEAPAAPGAE